MPFVVIALRTACPAYSCVLLNVLSELCWRRAFLFLPAVGQSCGVSVWHGPHSEHDLGWTSAADADDLCHQSGFQGSALAVALTNSRKHARPRITSPRPAQWWGQHASLTHFDCSVLKQQVMGFPRMSYVSLASVQRQRSRPGESGLATCPNYKWAVLSLTSSRLKMSCLHLVRVQFPFQKGSFSLSLQRGWADKCSWPYVLLGMPRKLSWGCSRVLQRMITNQYTATTCWIFIYNAGILRIKNTIS